MRHRDRRARRWLSDTRTSSRRGFYPLSARRQSVNPIGQLSACDGHHPGSWKRRGMVVWASPHNRGQASCREVQALSIVGYGMATRQSQTLSSARGKNDFLRFDLLGHFKRFWTKSGAVRDDGLALPPPVPPVHLRKRVHGAEDKDSFEDIGRIISDTVFSYVKVNDNVERFRGLDFGAGCGRVLAPLDQLCRKNLSRNVIEWYGSDIDRQAIAWCQKNLASTGKFVVNKPMPPLPFDNEFFDFVFSISVFTHIPEDMQFAWLAEINRVLKAGGTALLSTLPLDLAGKTLNKDQIAYGFHYSSGGKGTQGLPKFYQDSFHSRQYIEKEWSRYFSIEIYKEKGIANHQDLVLCRRI